MAHYIRTVFSNGATLIQITNSYIFYVKDCCGENGLLEHVIRMPLSDLSAVMLGRFNGALNSKNTNFEKEFREKWNIQLEKSPPLELEQLAAVYDGPIVAYSMFAEYANGFGNKTEKIVREMRARYADPDSSANTVANNASIMQGARDNLRFVNVRAHVDRLGECASSKRKDRLGECVNRPNSHRCIGIHGGHPTLAAWDLLEAFQDVYKV